MSDTPYERPKKKIAVEILTLDNERRRGALSTNVDGSLQDALNDNVPFISFEGEDGKETFIAKSALVQIVRTGDDARWTGQATRRETAKSGFAAQPRDPYAVLGVVRGSDEATVRTAYRALAKAYHPDHIMSLHLPPDMVTYGSEMLVAINQAYDTISRTFSGGNA